MLVWVFLIIRIALLGIMLQVGALSDTASMLHDVRSVALWLRIGAEQLTRRAVRSAACLARKATMSAPRAFSSEESTSASCLISVEQTVASFAASFARFAFFVRAMLRSACFVVVLEVSASGKERGKERPQCSDKDRNVESVGRSMHMISHWFKSSAWTASFF